MLILSGSPLPVVVPVSALVLGWDPAPSPAAAVVLCGFRRCQIPAPWKVMETPSPGTTMAQWQCGPQGWVEGLPPRREDAVMKKDVQ